MSSFVLDMITVLGGDRKLATDILECISSNPCLEQVSKQLDRFVELTKNNEAMNVFAAALRVLSELIDPITAYVLEIYVDLTAPVPKPILPLSFFGSTFLSVLNASIAEKEFGNDVKRIEDTIRRNLSGDRVIDILTLTSLLVTASIIIARNVDPSIPTPAHPGLALALYTTKDSLTHVAVALKKLNVFIEQEKLKRLEKNLENSRRYQLVGG